MSIPEPKSTALDACHTGRRMAAVLIMAVVICCPTVRAQSPFDPAILEVERQLIERMEERRAQDGFGSAELIGPLLALGWFYQEHGEHGSAASAFAQARQIIRANYGLHELDQAAALRGMIRSEEARGDIPTAWALEQELLALAKRHPEDLRTVPIFRELAERRADLLERYASGERPPHIVLGCYYATPPDPDAARPAIMITETPLVGCHAGSRSDALAGIERETLRYYANAIEVLLRNEVYASNELRALEREAVRIAYGSPFRCRTDDLDELLKLPLLDSCLKPLLNRNATTLVNMGGAASLVRLLSYEQRSSAPILTRTKALIDIIDLRFLSAIGRNETNSVLEMYAHAYQELRHGDVPQASIDEIFAPDVPVVLPALLPNPLHSEPVDESPRYIDVGFDITSAGRSRRISVLDAAPGVTRADERRLVRLIAGNRYRPRISSDGQIADASSVVLRYYLND
jgi:hypothetical protein